MSSNRLEDIIERESRGIGRRVLDHFIKHPISAAAIGFGAGCTYFFGDIIQNGMDYHPTDNEIWDYALNMVQPLWKSLAVGVASALPFKFLQYYEPRVFALMCLNSYYDMALGLAQSPEKKEHYADKRLQITRKICNATKHDSSMKFSTLGTLNFIEGDLEGAIDMYERAIRLKDKNPILDDWFMGRFDKAEYNLFKKRVKLLAETDPSALLEYAFRSMHFRQYDLTLIAWNRLVGLYPDELEIKCLAADALECLGERFMERADEILVKTAGMLAGSPQFRDRESLGYSENPVYTVGGKLTKATYVWKTKADKDSLEREFHFARYFRDLLGDRIAKPISVVKAEDGSWYYVSRSSGKSLYTLLEEGIEPEEKQQYFEDAIRLLAKIHALGKRGIEQGKLDLENVGENYFTRRIEEVFFDCLEACDAISFPTVIREVVLQNYGVVQDVLDKPEERVFYKDANLRNWVVSNGRVAAIDFDKTRRVLPQLDLVSLLEFERADLTEEQKGGLLRLYISERRKTGTGFDELSFNLDYNFAALHRHLELAGYRARDTASGFDNKKFVRYHLDAAIQKADTLYRAKYIIGEVEKESLRKLRDGLRSIKIKD